MKLHEELYFEITAEGTKHDADKFVSYLSSGVLDDYFEFDEEMITYSDNYEDVLAEIVSVTLSNDDYGVEIDELNPERLIALICHGGAPLYIHGHVFDIDDEDYGFISHEGDASFTNVEDIEFNDELDMEAYKEELEERDDY
jgi:hypothetical protein